jgi:hypothetical protein
VESLRNPNEEVLDWPVLGKLQMAKQPACVQCSIYPNDNEADMLNFLRTYMYVLVIIHGARWRSG